MSETVTNPAPTHDEVMNAARSIAGAVDPAIVNAATDAALAKPAPSTPLEAAFAELSARIERIERMIGSALPTVDADVAEGEHVANMIAPVVAALAPESAPILARLPALEALINRTLAALHAHFGTARVPNLPAPGDAP